MDALNHSQVRVRFAPSPTGFLHIGGARTALFNWLYARHTGGVFILRIEDTDNARNTQEAVDVILRGLKWLGLDWDEGPVTGNPSDPGKGGFGPYFQSQRMDIYKKRVQELKDKGMAYDKEGAVVFKMTRQPVLIDDMVVGKVRRELTDREQVDPDFVIVRSDGQPVFHLVNVIDDIEMGVTHVIRGEDHLANTAKHLALIEAFGVKPPRYAHIPLILNPDGTKMSKRDVGASMTTYIDECYAPEAVINYLALLGWSPKDNRDILPVKELVERFDLPQILRHNARFDLTKLLWMNGEYIRAMSMDRFVELGRAVLEKGGIQLASHSSTYIHAALATCKEKIKKSMSELAGQADFYFTDDVTIDAEAAKADLTPENLGRLARLRDVLSAMPAFDSASIGTTLAAVAAEFGIKTGVLVHPTRLACTGKKIGPSLYHLMEVLGKKTVLKRINRVLPQ